MMSLLLVTVTSLFARGVYQTDDDFISETFLNKPPENSSIMLGGDVRKKVALLLGHPYGGLIIKYWEKEGRTAWILKEIGKTEPITFGIVIKNSNKKNTQKIQKKLLSMGIQTRDFFWPMNKQKIYKKMGLFKGQNFPVAEYLANNGFYIPSGLGLKKTEMVKICKCINKIL